jgi:LacI family transcriptional regulator
MRQKITLETIAEQSGVSLATTSLVLSDKPGINPETRKRVLEVARKLGYFKNAASNSAASNRNQNLTHIGVIIRSQSTDAPQFNEFYSHVLAGIENTCRKQQINLLYATLPVDEDNRVVELPRLFYEEHVDGILLIGAFLDSTVEDVIKERNTPLVLVDAYSSGNFYDSVVSDNFNGAYQAVTYLIQKGHRHIAMVGSLPQSYPSIKDRRRGYTQALEDNNIQKKYFADSHWTKKEAYAAALNLLKNQPQITALFCANDDSAIGVLHAAHELNRFVPDDLSIVGFDDINLAQHVVPALTTMHVDKGTMGQLAVQLLANRVENPEGTGVTATIRPRLIERKSVKNLKVALTA